MGLVILISYVSYPILWDTFGTLTTKLLKEIHDEVILYKNETGSLPENLNNLLYYNIEKRTIYFQSKPLKGKLYFVSIGFPEDEIKGYDVNKIFHYEIVDNKPVIYTLGNDNKEGGGDDYFYPPKRFVHIPFSEFTASEFFLRTLIFGIPWTFAMTFCLYRMWNKRKDSGTSVPKAIVLSIVIVLFESFGALVIIGIHVYPHH